MMESRNVAWIFMLKENDIKFIKRQTKFLLCHPFNTNTQRVSRNSRSKLEARL